MQSKARNMEEVQKAQWQESDFVVCKHQGKKIRLFADLYGILKFTCFFLAKLSDAFYVCPAWIPLLVDRAVRCSRMQLKRVTI